MNTDFEWDAFICHASEDKKAFVGPLAEELRNIGLNIWFDKFTLSVGDRLRRSIDRGLARCRYGIVVLSPAFFSKQWPQHELDGLVALEMEGRKVILPVWHEVDTSDILKFSPPLADKLAARSSEGVAAVARSLVQVIRPDLFEIETTCADVRRTISRLTEQLKSNAPEFEYRISPAGDMTVVASVPPDKLLVGSAETQGLRIDVIAPDAAAYRAKPLFAEATLTKAGLDRLIDANRTGEAVTFGPDEVTGLKSELFRIAGLPSEASPIGWLTVSTSPDVLAKRMALRVAFVNGSVREEYPFIEFRFAKVGSEQFQIESCRPEMPLHLTVTLPWGKGRGNLKVTYGYDGHDIRRVCKAHRALQILFTGGNVELFDLEEEHHLGVLRDFPASDWQRAPWFDEFLEMVNEVADSLHEGIDYTRPTVQDVEDAHRIHQIVRTGEVALAAECVGLNLTPEQLRVAHDAFQRGDGLHLVLTDSPDFAVLLGKRLDLGCYEVFLTPSALTPETASPDAGIVNVQVALARPVLYRFPRFLPQRENPHDAIGTPGPLKSLGRKTPGRT